MILLVLFLEIALLLFPFSFIKAWKIDTIADPAIAEPVPAKPLMTGVRLTSWDGQRQLFFLRIDSLELIWKTLGPFQLEDHRDISANNCYLKSDSASLLGNLHEIEKLLVTTMQSLTIPIAKPIDASSPKLEATPVGYTENLVRLPPTLEARPFACTISQPQGIETILRADLATFDPTETDIFLEGNVKVKGGNQTCLTAEQIVWRVSPQELDVEGVYRFQTGEREIKGQDARFSITGGVLKPVKFTKIQPPPYLKELPSSAPIAPFMSSERGKSLRSRKKNILSHLSRTVLQMMFATVTPMDQRLTSEKNQGKEGSFSFSKPDVYPLPPSMTYSAEETVDRELFCEKSLIKYYKK